MIEVESWKGFAPGFEHADELSILDVPLHGSFRQTCQSDTYDGRLAEGACEAVGQIRPGTRAADFLALLQFLWQTPPMPDGMAQSSRLLDIPFRGLGLKNEAPIIIRFGERLTGIKAAASMRKASAEDGVAS